jgi:hypothetical protein
MSFNEQDFVQGIANLRYRTQREPQDYDMIDGKEYAWIVSQFYNRPEIGNGNVPCERCDGFTPRAAMYDCSKIVPIFRREKQYMICPECLSSLGKLQ